jgi:peptide/nickel transport system substrate-binding protein
MGRLGRTIAGLAAIVLLLGACTGGEASPPTPPTREAGQVGGTLRVGDVEFEKTLDPQKAYSGAAWEYLRCCLLRTLMAYNGLPTEEGGSEVSPDLAERAPNVSADGLTWTFTMRDGIRYAPPFDDVEVTAEDIIRALEREADPRASEGGYAFYYSVIEGFDAFANGDADSITGLQAPDGRTLVVTVTAPTGDLPYRFAMPATAPIPPDAPGERFGAAEGHRKDYGRFLVASGPYMLKGSEGLDFSLPPSEQESVYTQGEPWALVRNPSWEPATDELRPAYVDRVEFTVPPPPKNDQAFERMTERIWGMVDAGELDTSFLAPSADLVRRYLDDPELRDRLLVGSQNLLEYVDINLAVRPFEDVHVRKALNLVIDREAVRRRLNGSSIWRDGTITTHIVPDSLTGNLLANYRPSWLPEGGPDFRAARQEMRRSAYDRDGDGRCDGPSCLVVVHTQLKIRQASHGFGWPSLLRPGLKAIGIVPEFRLFRNVFHFLEATQNHPGYGLAVGTAHAWFPDFLNASNYFEPLLYGPNGTLVGASPQQLREWGYEITEVPSVDGRIESCLTLEGQAQTRCWADLDVYVSEEIVPWVPLLVETSALPFSDRVVETSFSQLTGYPALDHVVLAPDSE